MESDWQTGSAFTVTLADGTRIADPAQVIVAADPYRRLAYTWHTFSPEWAAHYNIAEDDRAAWASEPRSTVTFDIEEQGPLCKLTVLHDGFEAGSGVLAGISQGWPLVLAALKTLLETGDLQPARRGPGRAWYSSRPAATARFSDSAVPVIGIRTWRSPAASRSSGSPAPSAPSSSATGRA